MKTIIRPMLLLLVVAACVRSPATAPTPATGMILPDGLAGCYELNTAGRPYHTSPRLRLNTDTMPGVLRLLMRDSVPAWTLTRLDGEGRPLAEAHPDTPVYWGQAPESDSLRIMIHTGHSGTSLRVHAPPPGDTLRGRATEHWDMGPHRNDAGPVTLVRIPCTAAPAP